MSRSRLNFNWMQAMQQGQRSQQNILSCTRCSGDGVLAGRWETGQCSSANANATPRAPLVPSPVALVVALVVLVGVRDGALFLHGTHLQYLRRSKEKKERRQEGKRDKQWEERRARARHGVEGNRQLLLSSPSSSSKPPSSSRYNAAAPTPTHQEPPSTRAPLVPSPVALVVTLVDVALVLVALVALVVVVDWKTARI